MVVVVVDVLFMDCGFICQNVILHQLDVSDLPAVVAFAKSFDQSGHKVDVLVG